MRILGTWEAVASFMESGGQTLIAIFLTTILMWTFIFERILYLNLSFPAYVKSLKKRWEGYTEGCFKKGLEGVRNVAVLRARNRGKEYAAPMLAKSDVVDEVISNSRYFGPKGISEESPVVDSWKADQIRRMLISEVGQNLNRYLPMIKTLVAICPLLGLLGTVTGMIEVFDVMAVAGNANPRAMASGVSMATIPTMAGMVTALSGVYLSVQLKGTADKKRRRVEELISSWEV